MVMSDYKRLTKQAGWHKDIDLKDELGYSYIYQRLSEWENDYESGKVVKLPCNAVVLTREELQAHDKALLEKFAESLKAYINDKCCEELGDMACDTDYYTIDIPKTFDKIDEICKEITEV
jgi:hypothetical protein